MNIAILGQNFTLNVSFTNKDNTPFIVDSAVTYKVYSFDNTFILDGTAIQDRLSPSNWLANFTLPENSPVPNDMMNEQYFIEFFAKNNCNELQAKQYFQVLNSAEPTTYDSSISILENQPLKDSLITQYPVTSYTIKIMSESDSVLYSYTNDNPTCKLTNNEYITSFDSINSLGLAAGDGMFPYLIVYEYTNSLNQSNVEIHTLYIFNARMLLAINDMRRYLDKAKNYDIDQNLRWTDNELAHFILSGLQRFNSASPMFTAFNIVNFPKQLFYVLVKLAELEALNALYLAEGMRAFNFSGASTTLEVDRTQYIQTKMDEINSWVNENLTNIKTLLNRQMYGAGRVAMSLTSVTNRYGYNWRSPMYSRMINGFGI